jgi:hypothetical protein
VLDYDDKLESVEFAKGLSRKKDRDFIENATPEEILDIVRPQMVMIS